MIVSPLACLPSTLPSSLFLVGMVVVLWLVVGWCRHVDCLHNLGSGSINRPRDEQ